MCGLSDPGFVLDDRPMLYGRLLEWSQQVLFKEQALMRLGGRGIVQHGGETKPTRVPPVQKMGLAWCTST